MTIRWLLHAKNEPLDDASQELLFFALMVNATALSDLWDLTKPGGNRDFAIPIVRLALLLCAIASAVLYGGLRFLQVKSVAAEEFEDRLFELTLALSGVSLILAIVAEVIVAKIESTPIEQDRSRG